MALQHKFIFRVVGAITIATSLVTQVVPGYAQPFSYSSGKNRDRFNFW